MKLSHRYIVSLFILLSLFSSVKAHAEHFTIGVERLDYLPYYKIKDKACIGYARELFDQFAKDSGHSITYKAYPVARLFHAFINKEIDAKFPDNPQWKKQNKQNYTINYTAPIVSYTDGIMVKPDKLTLPQESFKKIGTIRGFTPWILMNDIKQDKINIKENNSISSLIQQTILGRLDGSFINISVAQYFLKHSHHGNDGLLFNPKLKNNLDYYYLSSLNKPQLIKEFDQWFKENATFNNKLLKRWDL